MTAAVRPQKAASPTPLGRGCSKLRCRSAGCKTDCSFLGFETTSDVCLLWASLSKLPPPEPLWLVLPPEGTSGARCLCQEEGSGSGGYQELRAPGRSQTSDVTPGINDPQLCYFRISPFCHRRTAAPATRGIQVSAHLRSLGDQQETAVPRGCHLIHVEEVARAEADPG